MSACLLGYSEPRDVTAKPSLSQASLDSYHCVCTFQVRVLPMGQKLLNGKAWLQCPVLKEDLFMTHEVEGNLCTVSSHGSCFYFSSNSFKCSFGQTILLDPLRLMWQDGFHLVNEMVTIFPIICTCV